MSMYPEQKKRYNKSSIFEMATTNIDTKKNPLG